MLEKKKGKSGTYLNVAEVGWHTRSPARKLHARPHEPHSFAFKFTPVDKCTPRLLTSVGSCEWLKKWTGAMGKGERGKLDVVRPRKSINIERWLNLVEIEFRLSKSEIEFSAK